MPSANAPLLLASWHNVSTRQTPQRCSMRQLHTVLQFGQRWEATQNWILPQHAVG